MHAVSPRHAPHKRGVCSRPLTEEERCSVARCALPCSCSPAIPAAASAKGPRMYTVSPVRDIIDRSALTVSGAAIIEVDHAEVVVTASKRTVKRTASQGLHRPAHAAAQAAGEAPARRRPRIYNFPRPTSTYHDYAEMNTEIQNVAANANPDRQPLQHRQLLRGPRDLGGQDQRQRRAPTRASRRCCSRPAPRARASHGRDHAVSPE